MHVEARASQTSTFHVWSLGTRGKATPRSFLTLAHVFILTLLAFTHASAEPVKIEFVPPPMEGTISLGIYDKAGKLVRVLHCEADQSELTAADDGLSTQWDGKDDDGKPCPSGAYHARGVMVGDLGIEGIGFIGNDWVTGEDSPRFRKIAYIKGAVMPNSGPAIAVLPPLLEDNLSGVLLQKYYEIKLKVVSDENEPEIQLFQLRGIPISTSFGELKKKPEEAKSVVEGIDITSEGTGVIHWMIYKNLVQECDKNGKVLRSLKPGPDDPDPVSVAASDFDRNIYVLYENATVQRLRGYDFTGVKPGDAPKVLFENDIHASKTYEQIASELKFPEDKAFIPSPKLTISLVSNPLQKNNTGTVELQAIIKSKRKPLEKKDDDQDGCYLATVDGLPLCRISDTKYLLWAKMGRPQGSKAISVFDSDGAVVEQFQINKVSNMMTFDAGEIQWKGEPTTTKDSAQAASPTPAPSASASPKPAHAK